MVLAYNGKIDGSFGGRGHIGPGCKALRLGIRNAKQGIFASLLLFGGIGPCGVCPIVGHAGHGRKSCIGTSAGVANFFTRARDFAVRGGF